MTITSENQTGAKEKNENGSLTALGMWRRSLREIDLQLQRILQMQEVGNVNSREPEPEPPDVLL